MKFFITSGPYVPGHEVINATATDHKKERKQKKKNKYHGF